MITSAVFVRTKIRDAQLTETAALPSAWGQMNPGEAVKDAAVPENKAMDPITDVPGLPRVLLIGDSISIAYTIPVRELLAGKANVHRIRANGSSTQTCLSSLESWLGDGQWDVVVFNCGIHDAKLAPSTGLPVISRETYVENLKTIVPKLKATGARVIFATSTPIPAILTAKDIKPGLLPAQTRLFDSIPERNELAVKALKEMDITIVDLYTVILPHQEKLQNKDDTHYNPEGSEILAQAVVNGILKQLPAKP